jgi:hypothetical protein
MVKTALLTSDPGAARPLFLGAMIDRFPRAP